MCHPERNLGWGEDAVEHEYLLAKKSLMSFEKTARKGRLQRKIRKARKRVGKEKSKNNKRKLTRMKRCKGQPKIDGISRTIYDTNAMSFDQGRRYFSHLQAVLTACKSYDALKQVIPRELPVNHLNIGYIQKAWFKCPVQRWCVGDIIGCTFPESSSAIGKGHGWRKLLAQGMQPSVHAWWGRSCGDVRANSSGADITWK